MDLSPPALTSLFGAALWYFKAVVLSGHLTWNIIQSVPQVACSWNSDSINQVRRNLRRGSCHLGSHQWKKEQLLRNGHVSAHWRQKKLLITIWLNVKNISVSIPSASQHSFINREPPRASRQHPQWTGKNRVTAHCSPMAHPAACLQQRMGWGCKRQLRDVKNLGKKDCIYTHTATTVMHLTSAEDSFIKRPVAQILFRGENHSSSGK